MWFKNDQILINVVPRKKKKQLTKFCSICSTWHDFVFISLLYNWLLTNYLNIHDRSFIAPLANSIWLTPKSSASAGGPEENTFTRWIFFF
jgi:hypothetical protein